MQEIVCIGVLREVTRHRAENTHVIHTLCNFREQLTDFNATLTILFEGPRRLQQVIVIVELCDRHFHRQWLAMVKRQTRLGVKGVHLAGAAIHVEEDDPFSARFMVQLGDDLRAG